MPMIVNHLESKAGQSAALDVNCPEPSKKLQSLKSHNGEKLRGQRERGMLSASVQSKACYIPIISSQLRQVCDEPCPLSRYPQHTTNQTTMLKNPTVHNPTVHNPTVHSPIIHSPTVQAPTVKSPSPIVLLDKQPKNASQCNKQSLNCSLVGAYEECLLGPIGRVLGQHRKVQFSARLTIINGYTRLNPEKTRTIRQLLRFDAVPWLNHGPWIGRLTYNDLLESASLLNLGPKSQIQILVFFDNSSSACTNMSAGHQGKLFLIQSFPHFVGERTIFRQKHYCRTSSINGTKQERHLLHAIQFPLICLNKHATDPLLRINGDIRLVFSFHHTNLPPLQPSPKATYANNTSNIIDERIEVTNQTITPFDPATNLDHASTRYFPSGQLDFGSYLIPPTF